MKFLVNRLAEYQYKFFIVCKREPDEHKIFFVPTNIRFGDEQKNIQCAILTVSDIENAH